MLKPEREVLTLEDIRAIFEEEAERYDHEDPYEELEFNEVI